MRKTNRITNHLNVKNYGIEVQIDSETEFGRRSGKRSTAQMVCGDYVPFEELVEEIQDSTVAGSAGVKAVVDRLVVTLVRHLRNGRRVCVGELGTFRLNFGSGGVENAADFKAGLIREPRVRFYPGKALRNMKSQANFERVDLVEVDVPSDGGEEEEERPGGL